ncbi:MAG: hypothetical protein N2560_04755 [Ignavibacteria bacterium]|nr:hypothetical protein [Ignavibacteria bacterium]
MQNYLLIFLIFVFFGKVFSQNPQKHYFSIDGKIQSILVLEIKGFEYFSFEKGNVGGFNFQIGRYLFYFLPGSKFFTFVDVNGNHHDFQMTRPAILLGQKLFIPFRSFLDCLLNSNLFEISFSTKSYAFKFKLDKTQKLSTRKGNEKYDKTNTGTSKYGMEVAPELGVTEEKKPTTETKAFPKLLLTNQDRFSLTKPTKTKSIEPGETRMEKPYKIKEDTTGRVPPKYYVLPPQLKNNPK